MGTSRNQKIYEAAVDFAKASTDIGPGMAMPLMALDMALALMNGSSESMYRLRA